MARYPCDMWMGVNAMCGRVRTVGLNPVNGDVYVFVGRSRKVMKILRTPGRAIPIMDAMEEWMKDAALKCRPSDPLGKALDYAYKLWPRLRRYALDGRYRIDNNAVFYSLLESCDIVGVKTLQWLTHVLEHLRRNSTEDEITALLHYNYKKSQE